MQPERGIGVNTPRGETIIRAGVEADAPGYRELRLEALLNHPTAFASDYETHVAKPPSFWVDRLRFEQTGDAVKMFFAAHDEELIGMSGVAHNRGIKTRHSGYLVSMYVRPEWRALGIADGLVTACLQWARTAEITILKLGVTTTNLPAIRCYARCGFQMYGIEPQVIYREGVYYDELLMARMT